MSAFNGRIQSDVDVKVKMPARLDPRACFIYGSSGCLNPFWTKGFPGARACLNMGSSRKPRGCEVRMRGSGQVFQSV